MRYLLAILLPPIAVLSCGKPVQALLNLVLTLLFWIPGAVHALFVVHGLHADRRTRRIIDSFERSRAMTA
ncbi:MAG: YqaE/Pmp3 family membrane protein [Planctomycetota bacterium]